MSSLRELFAGGREASVSQILAWTNRYVPRGVGFPRTLNLFRDEFRRCRGCMVGFPVGLPKPAHSMSASGASGSADVSSKNHDVRGKTYTARSFHSSGDLAIVLWSKAAAEVGKCIDDRRNPERTTKNKLNVNDFV